ncbi:PIG-L deacetylase family protein [Corallococcus aberystwythensis]|uniref:PIG-L family deacetylase n=1 Tax=Corallococcus aberystwythensis TaxID=2316722 RepID=A0A3A8PKZ4_9BACT|nr:PIG-L family deacetylase [Corallococcus aberystwythensis]RKH57053.1 PIG-L family deacetylase [Corallococcus aberystwythensis]
MSTALFVSPHLDDVAFSCGGTLAALKAKGWTVALVTVFTRSVPEPRGFALQCQTSKGLGPEVDYMAVRREEDQAFAACMGVDQVVWGGLEEAPHRGYASPEALFQPPRPDDGIEAKVAECLTPLLWELKPDRVFVPQALGSHVDHVQVVRAVKGLGIPENQVLYYRDTPYAVRQPKAHPDSAVPQGLRPLAVDITEHLPKKVEGCVRYGTQLAFQFGGVDGLTRTLTAFHRREAQTRGQPGAAEVFLTE